MKEGERKKKEKGRARDVEDTECGTEGRDEKSR